MTEHSHEVNPWKTKGTKVVYENPWIRVREDDVIRPDGKPGIYGVVETRLATGVLAITENDEVYLVGQYRYALHEYSWEMIEGGSDEGETALEAAKRELKEEAGLVAEHWEQLGHEVTLSNCHSDERGYFFVARGLTEGAANPEGTEDLLVKKVPIQEAIAMVDRGEIKDSMTVMALLRYARDHGL